MNYHLRLWSAGQPSGFDEEKLPPSIIGLEWVANAFLALSKRRHWQVVATLGGGGVYPARLSFPDIEAYCRFSGITDPDQREDLVHYLDVLDDVYIELMTPKTKKSEKPPSLK